MKKILLVMAVGLVLLLSGCGTPPTIQETETINETIIEEKKIELTEEIIKQKTRGLHIPRNLRIRSKGTERYSA